MNKITGFLEIIETIKLTFRK